jgi:catechol 2,3-dioxygenase
MDGTPMSVGNHNRKVGQFQIAEGTRIGYVHLRVSDLERSLSFYLDVLGFRMVSGGPHTATLSATGHGPGLIVLTEKKDAPVREPRATGLYHFAIRVPGRRALALMLRRLEEMKWPVDGYADHDVSEAVYLGDPDGLGIEIYADRPRDEWPLRNGQVEMVTLPLDVERVMRELDDWPATWEGIDRNTDIGHIHLRVANLENAEAFYHGVVGFDVTQRDVVGALFMSAGGYHHHVGANTWSSLAGPRPAADALGLIAFSVFLPDAESLRELERRLSAAGSPVRTEEDGSVRTADADGNSVDFIAR